MKPRPSVRRMQVCDLDDVLRIEEAVFLEGWSRKSYEYEISTNRFSIPLVLELEQHIIGHAVAWAVLEEFHVATLAVSAAYERQGYGEYLLRMLLSMADVAKYALLEVRASNSAAIHLYKKCGFEQMSIRKRYYKNGEDALVMKKDLK